MPTTVTLVRKIGEQFAQEGVTRTVRAQYLVRFSDNGGSADTAAYATDGVTSIPAYGSLITRAGVLLVCRSKSAAPHENSPLDYTVEVEFSSRLGATEQEKPENDTDTSWDVEVTFDSVVYSEPISYDINDVPIVNTAGDPLEPQPEQEYHDELVTITFKTTQPSIGDRLGVLRGRINADDVVLYYRGDSYEYLEGTIKIARATARPVTIEGVDAWEITLEWHVRNDGWKRKFINAGYRWKDSGGDMHPILVDGVQTTVPVKLKNDGTIWNPGDAEPTPLQFDTYETFGIAQLTVLLSDLDIV